MRVLVSGASGFIGAATVRRLAATHGFDVVAVARQPVGFEGAVRAVQVRSFNDAPSWAQALQGVDAIVHAAAHAHARGDSAELAAAFHAVNVKGALTLARKAHAAGVRRFVFISSVGVFGPGRPAPYVETDTPAPTEPYAVSKWVAEQQLEIFCRAAGIALVVIRPPLVYGPGAPGNFGQLAAAVRRGWPLPLASIHNRRSFLALDNLTDFIRVCLMHPAAAGQVFCVSDGHDVSTPQFIGMMAHALHRRARLWPVPPMLLRGAAIAVGRGAMFDKLAGSFCVDISNARRTLDWQPLVTLQQGLQSAMGRETM